MNGEGEVISSERFQTINLSDVREAMIGSESKVNTETTTTDKVYKAMLVGLVALNVADAVTTSIGLRLGATTEALPMKYLFNQMNPEMVLLTVKTIFLGAVVLSSEAWRGVNRMAAEQGDTDRAGWVNVPLALANCAFLGMVINNAYLISKGL